MLISPNDRPEKMQCGKRSGEERGVEFEVNLAERRTNKTSEVNYEKGKVDFVGNSASDRTLRHRRAGQAGHGALAKRVLNHGAGQEAGTSLRDETAASGRNAAKEEC
jgi:hypothetical protein